MALRAKQQRRDVGNDKPSTGRQAVRNAVRKMRIEKPEKSGNPSCKPKCVQGLAAVVRMRVTPPLILSFPLIRSFNGRVASTLPSAPLPVNGEGLGVGQIAEKSGGAAECRMSSVERPMRTAASVRYPDISKPFRHPCVQPIAWPILRRNTYASNTCPPDRNDHAAGRRRNWLRLESGLRRKGDHGQPWRRRSLSDVRQHR